MTSSSRRPGSLRALLAVATLALTTAGAGAFAASAPAKDPATPALTVPFALVKDRPVDQRLAQPEDRYAVAGGCYTIEAPGQGYVVEDASGGFSVRKDGTPEPFHFQPTRLGEYLLATNEGRDTAHAGATWDERGYLAAGTTLGLLPGSGVTKATAPSEDAEWRLTEVASKAKPKKGGKPVPAGYLLTSPARGAELTVQDGAISLGAKGTPLTLRHVADDKAGDADLNGTACASWPEVDTDAIGRPAPAADPAAPVQGFFEAHVHGMAFEFLGGELRCGRPWHEYGVEYALGNCNEEKNPINGLLEVPLGGQSPEYAASYDPQGWPTFNSWPRNRTLTHEQYYWRWLERAYLGGLRLTTNLLVDNEALCKLYPVKKNSCNEMDGVRLQAQRLFELQDYIDAQYGGPGEGWLRIVTSPAQARQVINAGRMAVVLGIEISALFDCTEVADQPQCTKAQIDERLQEVYDMGVRQMELVNKFDNALSGVTGDGGTTGVIVNNGNRDVTGHWWDMRTCNGEAVPHDHGDKEVGDQHDKTQLSPTDVTSQAPVEGVDALAGRVINEFGGVTKGLVAPVYPQGPHCNSRGLTELGKHLIRSMISKGMVFDPDHMSASAQDAALDLIEGEIVPAELKKAAKERRAPVLPAVLSSHSWGNEVIYQRIYEQQGVVAPRTDDAAGFAQRWQQLRSYAKAQAPAGYDFGMGYGADTNGLGGQPGPRSDAKNKLDYANGFEAPIGGVLLKQQSSGLRTFDINVEGVSQYGMFADWFREVRIAADERKPGAGDEITRDMLNGSETYLGIWERAVYGGGACVKDGSTLQVNDLHAALGLNLEGFLDAVGQPADRTGSAYTYCAEGDDGTEVVDVVFDDAGKAVDVRATTSDVQPVGEAGHDHGTHPHLPVGVPADGDLALGMMLVLGLTGLGAGTLSGRYRLA
ncbi:MAG: Sphingolipid ceramide N-deacylase [Frankiales bacterium]|nr:Sphingolipid ceramide N-deacylase [Frankiales bacterium]